LRLLLLLRSRLRLGRVLGGVRHLVEDVIVVAPVDTDKDALEVSEFLVFSLTQLALLREDVRLVPPLELLNVSHLHYLRKQLQLELGRDVVWLGDSLGLLLGRFGLDRLLNRSFLVGFRLGAKVELGLALVGLLLRLLILLVFLRLKLSRLLLDPRHDNPEDRVTLKLSRDDGQISPQ